MKNLDYAEVKIDGGFWKRRQEINRKITVNSVWNRFYDTGRITAFNFDWAEGKDFKPHIFWDSDVAKWIEGVAAILVTEKIPEFEEKIEWLVDRIEKNQGEDGYFNIYYTVCEPENRFTDRGCHELYCAGHLIEAAIEYFKASGKDRFLNLMKKYADYIYEVFCVNDSAAFVTPGHEEIEIALLKLYRATKNEKYLKLAMFFINKRGNNSKDAHTGNAALYLQGHLPVREQFTAEGHCVRAVYLYTAMADAAAETGDKELLNACERIFENITQHKMYITGGLGQTNLGEAFTVNYDLPPDTAYTETCASIGMVFFCRKMLEITGESKYADIIEREIFNGAISGVSLDGKSFFYENPLEINLINYNKNPATTTKARYPIPQRLEVFGCSCCPPNIIRFIAMMSDNILSLEGETYCLHQFMNCSANKITVSTDFPNSSLVKIKTEAPCLKVRIPSWCENFEINRKFTREKGYAVITDTSGEIIINLNLVPVIMEADTKVWAVAGKVALMYGPLVYCIESVDNGENLDSLYLSEDLGAQLEYSELFDAPVITVNGYKKSGDGLYRKYSKNFTEKRLEFIPYFAFANRGKTDMKVWVNIR